MINGVKYFPYFKLCVWIYVYEYCVNVCCSRSSLMVFKRQSTSYQNFIYSDCHFLFIILYIGVDHLWSILLFFNTTFELLNIYFSHIDVVDDWYNVHGKCVVCKRCIWLIINLCRLSNTYLRHHNVLTLVVMSHIALLKRNCLGTVYFPPTISGCFRNKFGNNFLFLQLVSGLGPISNEWFNIQCS